MDTALRDAALAAIQTDGSYLQALYRRKKPQLGHGRAIGAVKHSIILRLLAHAQHRRDL